MKRINLLGSLSSQGGGEQSLVDFSKLLTKLGWHVNLIPWANVNSAWSQYVNVDFSFQNGIDRAEKGIPLFFYGNDQVYEFYRGDEKTKKLVAECSKLIIGINFTLGGLAKTEWLAKSGKLRLVTFLNNEKLLNLFKNEDWVTNFPKTELAQVPNVINSDALIRYPLSSRNENEPLVVCRLSRADSRKFVTDDNFNKRANTYQWQRDNDKMLDIHFYQQMLDRCNGNVIFKFMDCPPHLTSHFKNHPNFKFFKWNEQPIHEFLSSSHVFLYRCSDSWLEQGPRVIQEALYAGLPCIVEPRDGLLDRIINRHNGFLCPLAGDFIDSLYTLYHNELLRQQMAKVARYDAIERFNPITKWADVIVNAIQTDYTAKFPTLSYGGAAPTRMEYEAIKVFVKRHGFKNILEFGPGTSTYAFVECDCNITSCECHDRWLTVAKEKFQHIPQVNLLRFNPNQEDIQLGLDDKKFDLCYVDSPPGKKELSRLNSCLYAIKRGIPIIIHDTKRPGEQQTIEYLKTNFNVYVEEILSHKGITFIQPL